MFEYTTEDLTDQEEEALIDKAAEQIVKRRMEVPAVLFLEMHKPLSFVASQAAVVFAPFIVPLMGYENAQNYTRLFQKRENVERLIRRIETMAAQPRAKDREAQVG